MAGNADWLDHPDVPKMARLAVRRKLRMFDDYHDLDFDSLYADVMGELVKAKYDPSKSQPGTFAYRVAWARLMDISRRRTKEAEKQAEGRDVGEVKRAEIDPDESLEEIATGIYAAVQANFRRTGVPIRTPHCGKPYPNRAQRATLHMLKERMGWKSRDASKVLKDNPDVLRAIGVTQTPSRQFFYRADFFVTQLKKIFAAIPAA